MTLPPSPRPASRRHRIEAAFARGLLRAFRAMGPVRSSNLAGGIARAVGPLLPASRTARRNLTLCLPHLGARAHRAIVRGAWENLGRTVGEFPHLGTLPRDTAEGPGWRVHGDAPLVEQAARGGPALFVSGHIGNWEVMPMICARYGAPIASFYRAADNPLVDAMIRDLRHEAAGSRTPLFPKGSRGARDALRHIGKGGRLGVLADQKMNDGVEARLFGLPAMTAGATAAFAQHNKAPIILGRVLREGPCRFVLISDHILLPDPAMERQEAIATLTQAINDRLEAWIRETPESWLWMHKRFPKSFYRADSAATSR